MSSDIITVGWGWSGAGSGWRPGVVLSILQCTGQYPSPLAPQTFKIHLAPNVNSVEAEKS